MRPILFHLGPIPIPSYEFFVALAVLAALLSYAWEARRAPKLGENAIYILLAAMLGGALGAKLPIWVQHWHEIVMRFPDPAVILPGRTVVGGLIGGTLAVIAMKRLLHIPAKTGNLFAPGIALGIGIGRIGCLLYGCCHGLPTHAPWGVTGINGLTYVPVQIIESFFAFILFGVLLLLKRRVTEEGRLFAILMIAYFAFRFAIEFLRAEPRPYGGLTLAQVVSLGVVAYYGITGYLQRRKRSACAQ